MSKILYAAGTMEHIKNFHLPYIDALRKDGHEVLIMARGVDADFNIEFEKKMLSFKNRTCQKKIKRILKEEKFDALILNTTLAAFNIRWAMPRKNRPKVINFVHGYMFGKEIKSTKDRIFLLCEKLLRKKTDSIMVMNEDDLEIAKKYKLCRGDIKMTLGMGARVPDESATSEDLICKYHESQGKYIMTFVGELYKAKNQRMLICALPEIQLEIPNAVLWLVGEGVARPELVDLVDELNLSNSVCFMGKRKNPCDYIRASHLYVSASEKEGLPFNILEALGCGRTVIASDIKGHRDIIEDGKSGFLFPYGDINEFVSLVKRVHKGEITIDPADAIERYKNYSFDNVFAKTYGTMKELFEK